MFTSILETLRGAGWHVEEKTPARFVLPAALQQRYPSLPPELTTFLAGLNVCSNGDETAWFFVEADYYGRIEEAWRWNEVELMDMTTARDDALWQDEIRSFWNDNFPFFFSVTSGYSFFAVSLRAENYGAVVHGFSPEFSEISEIAPSFPEFLTALVATVEGKEIDDLIRVAIS